MRSAPSRAERIRAQAWADKLIESTGWGKGAADPMPLGAVCIERSVVLLADPSTRGVWPWNQLWVAPLRDVALWLGEQARQVSLEQEVFENQALKSAQADPDVFLARKSTSEANNPGYVRFSGQELGSHMGVGFITRNAADYLAAPVGDLVELDELRGARAMLCARISGAEGLESMFGRDVDRAVSVLAAGLGPLAFCCQNGSGRVPGHKHKNTHATRAWPSSKEQWRGMWLAREEAWDLAEDLDDQLGKPGSSGALRV
jgi:hypothetical protein